MEQPIITPVEQTQAEKLARREQAAKIKRRKKRVKRLIILVIVLAICGGIYFGISSLFKEKEVEQVPWSEFVYRGSITSLVEGNGVTKAKDSETLTLTSDGVVEEVFVAEGDMVMAGDPLYTVSSPDAEADVTAAQKVIDDLQKQINSLSGSYVDLVVTAPFSGKLMDTADLNPGDECGSGMTIAKLVDDKTMKLSLYFSYAYENDIYVGKTAQISIPSTMNVLTGTVSQINKVNRVSPQGSKLFEVVFTMTNPGTLTADMGATAILTAGELELYPYEPGVLEYNRSQDITAKASGPVQSVNLMDYADVTAGTTLLRLGGENNDDQMSALNESMASAVKNLETAQAALANYNAVASISGRVMSCSLMVGEEVEAGRMAVSISDTTVMTVEANIDEMNVSYVKPGMMVDITQYGMNGEVYLMGIVESVSMEGSFENGMSSFPAIIKVDNPMGELMSGMYVNYSLAASQSENCLLVPQQAVKYTQAGTVVFVKGEAPEGAMTEAELNGLPPEGEEGMTEPGMGGPDMGGGMTIPEGFYPVAVTVGLADQTNAEILSGLEEGQEVFIQMMTDSGSSWDDMGMGGGMMVG